MYPKRLPILYEFRKIFLSTKLTQCKQYSTNIESILTSLGRQQKTTNKITINTHTLLTALKKKHSHSIHEIVKK